MDNVIGFLVRQQLRRVEAEASANQAGLRSAGTLRDTVRLGEVRLPPELRYLRQSIGQLRLLRLAVDRRLRQLIELRLQDLKQAEDREAALAALGRLMHECQILRGQYAAHFRWADAQSSSIVHQWRNPVPRSSEAPANVRE